MVIFYSYVSYVSQYQRVHMVNVYENGPTSGWLVVEPYPSEKYEFVNWDDYSIPNIWKNAIHVPVTTNQI